MDPLERLTNLFEKFPGIGPRQAQRFVQFLLRSPSSSRKELVEAIQEIGGKVSQCLECMRFHAGSKKTCSMCSNPERDARFLAIVASDADLAALDKSGTYRGYYFVLGGTLHLASEKTSNLRVKELLASLPKRADKGLGEVILAFPANPEGDMTGIRVREEIVKTAPSLRITSLGRGLSTGSELEYADPDTIRSAFESRK